MITLNEIRNDIAVKVKRAVTKRDLPIRVENVWDDVTDSCSKKIFVFSHPANTKQFVCSLIDERKTFEFPVSFLCDSDTSVAVQVGERDSVDSAAVKKAKNFADQLYREACYLSVLEDDV